MNARQVLDELELTAQQNGGMVTLDDALTSIGLIVVDIKHQMTRATEDPFSFNEMVAELL